MTDQVGGAVSRRTVLIGGAGALPLIALGATGAKAARWRRARSGIRHAEGRQAVQRLQPVRRAERLQERRRDDSPTGWCALWVKKAGLTVQPRSSFVNEI